MQQVKKYWARSGFAPRASVGPQEYRPCTVPLSYQTICRSASFCSGDFYFCFIYRDIQERRFKRRENLVQFSPNKKNFSVVVVAVVPLLVVVGGVVISGVMCNLHVYYQTRHNYYYRLLPLLSLSIYIYIFFFFHKKYG